VQSVSSQISADVNLSGRLAVVTGAARGIGRATALALARAGADVAALDVLDSSSTVAEVQAYGRWGVALQVDVRSRPSVLRAIGGIGRERGRIDILVTAAGIYGKLADLLQLEEDEVDEVLAANLKGTLWSIQAAWSLMVGNGGKIVCVGSVAGKVGGILAGAHYAASKGGVHALVKWAAKAGAPYGILVNGVAPGAIDTDMIRGLPYSSDYCPLRRLGQPEDVAQAVLFLSSQASNYITGAVIDVSGGYFMG